MKVILSVDPVKFPLTGIGRYTFELARHLGGFAEIERLRFLHGWCLTDTLPNPPAGAGTLGSVRGRLLKSRLAVAAYRAFMSRLKARALRGLEDHVFHGPNFYLPPFPGRSVVTLHDLSPYTWTDCHPPERVRYMQAEIELSLRRATMLIADSEFGRREMADYFGWPLERIRAVPLASSGEFFPRDAAALTPRLAGYGLNPGGYCLFAGTIEPRKNVEGLLDAYGALPETVRRRWPLVIAGYRGWNSTAIHARMADAARAGWVRYLGFVAGEDLPWLFAGARLFAFPSRYEGFGLPVLEAMASGVPVICSDAASLPEVAGDAAAMCAAADVDSLGCLLAAGLEDERWRAAARAKSLAQAARFSWERCARETANVYRAALALS